MKKLFFALASFALISSAHAASDTSDVKFNAEMWFKYYSNKNADFADSGTNTYWTQRTKMGAHWSKGDDLGAQVTLLSGVVWGSGDAARSATVTTNNGLNYVGQGIDVYEAWAFWKAMDNLVIKVGRGAMDLADGTVVSKNDDRLHPYTFDGILGAFYTEPAAFNFFGVKGNDSSTADELGTFAANDQEVNFYGLSVDLRNLPEVLKMVNIHVLEEKAYGLGGAADVHVSRLRYGLTLKGDVSGFDYRGTYAAYSGKQNINTTSTDIDLKGNMMDLEAGYTLKDVMGLRISALYHKDSGDESGSTDENKHYDSFFYDEHNNAGLMDVLKWGNLKYFKIGASVEPMEMVNVGLDYYSFSKTVDTDTVTVHNAAAGVSGESKVGSEWDLHATKKVSNGTVFGLRYSMFTPDEANFGSGAKKESQMYADAKFTF
jgi:hypothetical protein